jgi:hypothetical protein
MAGCQVQVPDARCHGNRIDPVKLDRVESMKDKTVTEDKGIVVTLWKFTWRERLKIALAGRLYLTVATFNQPLQPVQITMDKPKLQ